VGFVRALLLETSDADWNILLWFIEQIQEPRCNDWQKWMGGLARFNANKQQTGGHIDTPSQSKCAINEAGGHQGNFKSGRCTTQAG
jgi:hypothetical protein